MYEGRLSLAESIKGYDQNVCSNQPIGDYNQDIFHPFVITNGQIKINENQQ